MNSHDCICCARTGLGRDDICFWCRRSIAFIAGLSTMTKHSRLKAYDRAFIQIVKMQRRAGFPPWRTVADMDEFAEKRSAAEGRSWREHVDEETRGQFGWSALRGYVYIVNSTWGSVPWENAHTVPASGQDRFSDPIIDDKSGYEPLCRHGKPLSHQCDKCDEDTVADGGGALMDVEGGKKKLLRKKKVFRKKGGSQ